MSTQPDTFSAPIEEADDAVSYAGVRLPKAENRESPLTPEKGKYAEYINDRFTVLQLQQKLAISFLMGEPILIEAGTSIGKTTAVRKMASELGWEVHYVNLNGATDVEDLMGKYIPNANKTSPTDPEYVFADGRVTSGLRQEKGKIKVIILDEFNAAAPNVLIRLHEVLDALERGGKVVLSEDASEDISTSKELTKVVAFMNPPGKGYLQRPALDPAQLRRWVYQKLPDRLPPEAFKFSTKALFGLGKKEEHLQSSALVIPRDYVLTDEQMGEIPGIEVIAEKYMEFHAAANGLLQQRSIASGQPQPFAYDDREEPRRVRDFVACFYNGDITETFQKALRYYYVNKLLADEDRQMLEELVSHVSYTAPAIPSKRKGLGTGRRDIDAEIAERKKQILDLLEVAVPTAEAVPMTSAEEHEARELMGAGRFFGLAELEQSFDIKLKPSEVPALPPRKEVERHAKLGHTLRLRCSKAADDTPLTMKRMAELMEMKFKKDRDGKVLFPRDWYKKESFFTKEVPKTAWVFTTDTVLSGSTGKDYLQQTDYLRIYLSNSLFKGESLPREYEEAVREYEAAKSDIAELMESDWQAAAKKLSKLRLNQLLRATPVDALFDFIQTLRARGDKKRTKKRILKDKWAWTNGVSSGGSLVSLGRCASGGARVSYAEPNCWYDDLGVSLSREFP